MTRVALRIPAFAEIVRTYRHRLPPASGTSSRVVENRNLLLWFYPGAIGVKTGYLAAAGHCLVAAADRNGIRLVTVVLGHPDTAFGDGALLLDYGYRGFQRTTVIRIRQAVGLARIADTLVPAVSGGELSALVSLEPPGVIATRLHVSAGLSPPVEAGARVGRVAVFVDGQRVGAVPALAAARPTVYGAPPGGSERPPTGGSPVAPPPQAVLRAVGILGSVLREMADAFL
jgi:D-alanyl-D-alanine carboxypeptidase